jgi:hypothetical protein
MKNMLRLQKYDRQAEDVQYQRNNSRLPNVWEKYAQTLKWLRISMKILIIYFIQKDTISVFRIAFYFFHQEINFFLIEPFINMLRINTGEHHIHFHRHNEFFF